MKQVFTSLLLAFFMCTSFGQKAEAQGDFAQTALEQALRVAESLVEQAEQFTLKAKKLGFDVYEVRFEMSLTPSVDIFLHDRGDTGHLRALVAGSSQFEALALRLLHATRKFELGQYKAYGVKVTIGLEPPSVVILTKP